MSKATIKKSARAEAVETAEDVGYLDLGRVNQKQRTRDALVAVAVEAIRAGRDVSVTEIADAARVSRTTAYRYFPTSDMLAAQATLTAADVSEVQHLNLIATGQGTPAEKLDAIIEGCDVMIEHHEAAFRSLVKFTVEARIKDTQNLPRRPTFRLQWIEAAIADLRPELGSSRFSRLCRSLCLLCGVESVIVLNDICHLPIKEARDTKRWMAQQLLKAALREAKDDMSGERSTKLGQLPGEPGARRLAGD